MKLGRCLALAAALLLAGCDKETTLHSGLEERQANLVMAALLDAGIDCRKAPGNEGTWEVMVDEDRFADAVNLLERQGLPRRPRQGVGEVFKKPVFHEDGTFELRDTLPIGITLDERIADGYYYAKTVRLVKKLIENPELLDRPANEEVEF